MKLIEKTQYCLKTEGYSSKTSYKYTFWIRYFINFHYRRHPAELQEMHLRMFFLYLRERQRCTWSEINQCRSALLFLYRRVMGLEDFVIADPGHPSEAPNPAILELDTVPV